MIVHPTETAFQAYVDTQAGAAYLQSDEFERRCADLDKRMAGGISVQDAAELVGLPIDVFRYLFALLMVGLANQMAMQAEAGAATKH